MENIKSLPITNLSTKEANPSPELKLEACDSTLPDSGKPTETIKSDIVNVTNAEPGILEPFSLEESIYQTQNQKQALQAFDTFLQRHKERKEELKRDTDFELPERISSHTYEEIQSIGTRDTHNAMDLYAALDLTEIPVPDLSSRWSKKLSESGSRGGGAARASSKASSKGKVRPKLKKESGQARIPWKPPNPPEENATGGTLDRQVHLSPPREPQDPAKQIVSQIIPKETNVFDQAALKDERLKAWESAASEVLESEIPQIGSKPISEFAHNRQAIQVIGKRIQEPPQTITTAAFARIRETLSSVELASNKGKFELTCLFSLPRIILYIIRS